jgi:hypothetical protein
MATTLNPLLAKLDMMFSSKPLLIGGRAMEYYGLRPSGEDIDFVVTSEDYEQLARKYPEHLKDIWGDLGVCVYEFELWRTICLFDYLFLSVGALQEDGYLVISLEKLLFLKALGIKEAKSHRDLELIVEKVLKLQYEPVPAKNEVSK